MTEAKTHRFEAEVSQVLHLVINSLYSNKEIFLRELISNASDALDKLRFRAVTSPELIEGEDADLRVRIEIDAEAGTLTLSDNGVGMTEEELVENLGTVAHSGTQAFLSKLAEAKKESSGDDPQLIGQFGVGFYSAFLVADRVTVTTRSAGSRDAFRWMSDGKETFIIEGARRLEQGTDVTLHLKDDQKEYLEEYRIRGLVQRYSDYIHAPVELRVEKKDDEGGSQGWAYERLNQGTALWRKNAHDVSDDQYAEFYKHLTHDWQPPLVHQHFKIEGTQEFSGLLFIPQKPPADLFMPDAQHGVRLYVKRVFIMDDCDEVLPKWLRFVRGVVDSEDLPLNVSREILQDSRVSRTIRNQVVKQALTMIGKLEKSDDYATFWSAYGAVLKEGLHFEPEHKEKLLKLVRYESTKVEGLTSLSDYVERMPEEQDAIYYALGAARDILEHGPHLEALRERGFEVLLMTDPIDQWSVGSLNEYQNKKLVSAMDADLTVPNASEAEDSGSEEKIAELLNRFSDILREHVSEVRISKRLTSSPTCLVMPQGGLPPYLERLMRLQNEQLPAQKRILEVNPNHPLIASLSKLYQQDPKDEALTNWVELVYDQALLAEGSPIESPAVFAERMTRLMTEAAQRHVNT